MAIYHVPATIRVRPGAAIDGRRIATVAAAGIAVLALAATASVYELSGSNAGGTPLVDWAGSQALDQPTQSGDWNLSGLALSDDGFGHLAATASITSLGTGPDGTTGNLLVRLYRKNQEVADLSAAAPRLASGAATSISLTSSAVYSSGDYKYSFEATGVPPAQFGQSTGSTGSWAAFATDQDN